MKRRQWYQDDYKHESTRADLVSVAIATLIALIVIALVVVWMLA